MTKKKEVDKLEQILKKHNLTEKELTAVLKSSSCANNIKREPYKVGKSKVKFGVFGDTHIGNIHYDRELMTFAGKEFQKAGVDFVLHTGDVCDGLYTNRPGHIFELDAIGYDAQVKLAEEEFKKLGGLPLYFITGNHTRNTFYNNAGVEIGNELEHKINNSKFLGNGEGEVVLKGGASIRLLHPDGGTAYAISYRSQKIAESLSGGKKPNILLLGHFHKSEYIFYRNIHIFQTGTLEGQTQFMRGKHIPAHKGFWIIDVNTSGKEIDRINQTFYPSYD